MCISSQERAVYTYLFRDSGSLSHARYAFQALFIQWRKGGELQQTCDVDVCYFGGGRVGGGWWSVVDDGREHEALRT